MTFLAAAAVVVVVVVIVAGELVGEVAHILSYRHQWDYRVLIIREKHAIPCGPLVSIAFDSLLTRGFCYGVVGPL